ncbi:MAG: TonB-dependent receptor [Sphingomonadaceae bacterium]
MKSRFLVSCAVTAFLFGAGPAFAADQGDQTSPTDAASDAPVIGNDILVTAQRREQKLQDVPATIQAFSGESLDRLNIRNLDDFAKYVPNLTLATNGPGQGGVFIRGLAAGFAGNQSSATIGTFPNVAIYLDDQALQFPGRNVDIYPTDLERIEVLEGPQGTLFGGGAQAGAVRFITNKPKLDKFEGRVDGSYGFTSGGAPNSSVSATLNVPVITDRFALRLTVYNDRRGGYIDNVTSNFTRSNSDPANFYFGIRPNTQGICPNGLPAAGTNACAPNAPVEDNSRVAGRDANPVTYTGARLSAKVKLNDDWDVLLTESLQNLDTQGVFFQFPIGSDFQPLRKLETTFFNPTFSQDKFSNTALTVNGKAGPLNLIYTGAYLDRRIFQQQDYTNYSRTGGGTYYECAGATVRANGGFGNPGQPTTCYSALGFWNDRVRNREVTNEFRVSTPDTWRIRAIGGVFFEDFKIFDNQNFNYKSIPSCNATRLAASLAGGPACIANVGPAAGFAPIDPTTRGDSTAFGQDVLRGYKQFAAFASVDFDIIPKVLTITAGTRYFRYSGFQFGTNYVTNAACLNVLNGQCGPRSQRTINERRVDTGFRSRANITWHFNPKSIVYATFSQGFRPGGFNRTTQQVAPFPVASTAAGNTNGFVAGSPQYQREISFGPDTLNSYEVGFKTQLFDNKLQLNVSAYVQDWKRVQLGLFFPPILGNSAFNVNGPDFRVKGVEVQFTARPIPGLTIDGSGAYNESRQTNSPSTFISNIPASPTFGQPITNVFQNGIGSVPFGNPFGRIGGPLALSPNFHGSGRIRYDWDAGSVKPFVQVGANYTGFQFNLLAGAASGEGVLIPRTAALRYRIPAYTTVDASIGISGERWRAELYSTNLTNTNASTFTSSGQFIRAEAPVRPRTFGLKVGFDY